MTAFSTAFLSKLRESASKGDPSGRRISQNMRVSSVDEALGLVKDYQDEIRKAALAAATADSVLLYSEGISIKADSLAADTMHLAPTGYLE